MKKVLPLSESFAHFIYSPVSIILSKLKVIF